MLLPILVSLMGAPAHIPQNYLFFADFSAIPKITATTEAIALITAEHETEPAVPYRRRLFTQ